MRKTAKEITTDQPSKSVDNVRIPTVSVLMTAYNAMPFLSEAIESILKQDFPDFELVIVNDGSTDDSKATLDAIDDQRVVVFHHENKGTAAASNFGLSQCRGEFIARMDADDISLPHRLSTQVEFLRANPDVGLVGSHVRIMGSDRIGMRVDLPLKHDAIMDALMRIDNGMTHGSSIFRRELIEQIGGYWSLRSYDDWDMFIRMGEVSKLANVDDVLYHYRYLTTGLVGSGLRNGRRHYAYSVELLSAEK